MPSLVEKLLVLSSYREGYQCRSGSKFRRLFLPLLPSSIGKLNSVEQGICRAAGFNLRIISVYGVLYQYTGTQLGIVGTVLYILLYLDTIPDIAALS